MNPLGVACPKCSAAAGKPCLETGRPLDGFHPEREARATRASRFVWEEGDVVFVRDEDETKG
jgi:hypothetical protein